MFDHWVLGSYERMLDERTTDDWHVVIWDLFVKFRKLKKRTSYIIYWVKITLSA